MSTELVTMNMALVPESPTIPTLPAAAVAVRPIDLYGALLADARKPTTRRARRQDIADLDRFLARKQLPPDPSLACAMFVAGGAPRANAIATAYTRSMLDKPLSPATINRRISTLRRLVKLARRFEVITWGLDVDSQPVENYRDTTGPGRAGWLRLLAAARKAAGRTAKGKRDLAIVLLLHDQGSRRAEVTGLDLADLDAESGRLMVMGKGKTEKAPMTLNARTLLALADWIAARGSAPGALFIRLDNARVKGQLSRLDGDGVHLVVAHIGLKAKLSRPVKPHGLRHQAITRVLQLTNGNIDAGQKFARHKDPKTTQRYNDNRADVAGAMARLLGDDS
jgi:integrase/recombinase XerC